MEKRGIVDEENTTPEPEKRCCGGKCSTAELADHLMKRAADGAEQRLTEIVKEAERDGE